MCAPKKIKLETPKPPELPPAIPAAIAFQQSPSRALEARTLNPSGSRPDIRIGSGKSGSSARNRNSSSQGLSGSLSISGNRGLNI